MLKKPVEAVLFDMDGLLLDTEAVYIVALQAAARTLGREMPLDFCHSMIGVPTRECNVMIQAFYGDGFRDRGVSPALFRPRAPPAGSPHPAEAGRRRAAGFPGRPRPAARRRHLRRHAPRPSTISAAPACSTRFGAVATRDDVEHPKPHPGVYLEAARRLGVAPDRCIAFEDSNVGLAAAHAAGAMAFMVPDILQPLPEIRAKCVESLPDLHAA